MNKNKFYDREAADYQKKDVVKFKWLDFEMFTKFGGQNFVSGGIKPLGKPMQGIFSTSTMFLLPNRYK
jgi:hypothetical protein